MNVNKPAEALLISAMAILENQGEVTLKLHGNCMWPTVKNGDLVTFIKTAAEDFRFGDVAVCKISDSGLHVYTQFWPSFLVRSKKQKNNSLLGKVTKVSRNGTHIDLNSRGFFKRLYHVLLSPANPLFLWIYLTRLWNSRG